MLETFEEFENLEPLEERALSDEAWKALDKLALYLHKNPELKDAISSSMAELGDDVGHAFLDGVKGNREN